mgnify:CR=1 FL=1|tara:strand:+ start:78 stop:725 length:648 start_codon:yes stop_codon:yes gene_type:complete
MATPSSGAISLDQMNVEAGGSSGSTVSMNDSQIRFLDSKSANATSSFNDFYGIEAGGGIMSVGGSVSSSTETVNYQVITTTVAVRGFFGSGSSASNHGSLTNTTISNFLGGNTIFRFRNFSRTKTNQSPIGPELNLEVTYAGGTVPPNSNTSFTKMLINETTFNRSDATYTNNSGALTANWSWSHTHTIVTSTSSNDPPFPPITSPETTVPYTFI